MIRGARFLLLLVVAVGVLLPEAARAQLSVGAEARRDRSTWHFDNPSSFDTSELVPHYFEQRYRLDNLWLTARAAYRAGIDWQTTFGVTPSSQTLATDYDTFFDPGGVTWVAGTTGDATVHSFRVAQAIDLGRAGPVSFSGGYRLTLNLASFLAGDRTDTRNGVVVARTIVTAPEYTNAQTHEIFVQASAERPVSGGWTVRVSGDAAPAAVNRLAIRLPGKYPGQTLVFRTTNVMTGGQLEFRRTGGHWPVAIALDGVRSWNYHSTQWTGRSALGVGISAGRAW